MTRLASLPAATSSPLITHYDLKTGERTELSGMTTANWVAKTANFLTLDLDVAPGRTIRIGLPTHWLRFVWLLAAWRTGCTVVDHEERSFETVSAIGVSGPDLLADEPVKVACSLLPFAARFREPPEGFLDMSAEVLGHADTFVPFDPPTESTLAVSLGGHRETHSELIERITPDSRRLLLSNDDIQRDTEALVAACLGGGSLVTVNGGSENDLVKIALQEKAAFDSH